MRPPFYVRQLRRDLDDWIAKGLIPESSRAAILEAVSAGGGALSLSGIIGILGVILIALAAMSFVAANWAEMGKMLRLILLFGAMWLAYGLGAQFHAGKPLLSQAFILLGVLLFGANIMLVGQTYHISAHFPDGVLLWAMGALLTAALANSRASLAAALLLIGYWTWTEYQYFDRPIHIPFLFMWAPSAALAAYWAWRPAIHLSALTLIFWLVISAEGIGRMLGWHDIEVSSIFVFLPLAAWAFVGGVDQKNEANSITVEHYAFVLFLITYSFLHLMEETAAPSATWVGFAAIASAAAIGATALGLQRGGMTMIDLAGVAFTAATAALFTAFSEGNDDTRAIGGLICILVVIVWSIARGTRNEDRFVVNLSILAFGIWVLYAYFAAFAKFLDQSMFFAIGGVLLVAMSFVLETVRRRLVVEPSTAIKGATP
jgi:uncharacterized membrane protein